MSDYPQIPPNASTYQLSRIKGLRELMDIWGAVPPGPDAPWEADHLEPIDPFPWESSFRYSSELRTRLYKDVPYLCKMLVIPEYDPESVVSLKNRFESDLEEGDDPFILRYAEADQNIHFSMSDAPWREKPKEVQVKIKSVGFPEIQGSRILAVWGRMLARTRYPEKDMFDFYRTRYQFSKGSRHGEVRGPGAYQSPLLFVGLGYAMECYCCVEEERRSLMMSKIEVKLDHLERYLDEHSVTLNG